MDSYETRVDELTVNELKALLSRVKCNNGKGRKLVLSKRLLAVVESKGFSASDVMVKFIDNNGLKTHLVYNGDVDGYD